MKYKNPSGSDAVAITVDVMVPVCKGEDNKAPEMEVITIKHNQIVEIGAVRLTCPKDLRTPDNQKSIYKSLQVREEDYMN